MRGVGERWAKARGEEERMKGKKARRTTVGCIGFDGWIAIPCHMVHM